MKDVASVDKKIHLIVESLRKTTITTVNHDQAYQPRTNRRVLPLHSGLGTALVLVPALKNNFCHLTTSLGFCGEAKNLEGLQKENYLLNEKLDCRSLAAGKKLRLITDPLNCTQQQIRQTSQSSNANFWRIQAAFHQLLNNTHTQTGSDYCVGVKSHTLYSDKWGPVISGFNFL